MVIKDLISGDGAKAEVVDLNKIIKLKDDQILLYKAKDSLKDEKIKNLDYIIVKKDEQFNLERQKSESLLKELKQQKFKGFFYKVGSVVGIVATSLLLLK